jgi:hypothetical protein
LIKIKKTDTSANAITIDGNGAETIDGDLTAVIQYPYTEVDLMCNGTAWSLA